MTGRELFGDYATTLVTDFNNETSAMGSPTEFAQQDERIEHKYELPTTEAEMTKTIGATAISELATIA